MERFTGDTSNKIKNTEQNGIHEEDALMELQSPPSSKSLLWDAQLTSKYCIK